MKKCLLLYPTVNFCKKEQIVGGHLSHFYKTVEQLKPLFDQLIIYNDSFKNINIGSSENIIFINSDYSSNIFKRYIEISRLIFNKKEFQKIYIRYSSFFYPIIFFISIFRGKDVILEVNTPIVHYNKNFLFLDLLIAGFVSKVIYFCPKYFKKINKFYNFLNLKGVIKLQRNLPCRNIVFNLENLDKNKLIKNKNIKGLYVGSVKRGIGINDLINSTKNLSKNNNFNFELFIYTSSNLKNYFIPSNIKVKKSLSQLEISKLYRDFDVLFFTSTSSYDYGSPLKLSEYLLTGMPIIAYPHPELLSLSISKLKSLYIYIGYSNPLRLYNLINLVSNNLEFISSKNKQIIEARKESFIWLNEKNFFA